MQRKIFFDYRWSLIALSMVVLTACGGGGGAGVITNPGTGTGTGTASFTTTHNTVALDAAQAGLVTVKSTAEGSSALVVAREATGALAQLQVGQSIHIPAGEDSRFPLGFSGVAETITKNSQGQTEVTLKAATLADVYSKSSIKQEPTTLSADNFIGAIAPLAIRGTGNNTAPQQVGLIRKSVTALNGALTLRPAKLNAVDSLMTGVSFFGDNATLQAGEIGLNVSVDLAEFFKDEPARLKPYGASGKAGFAVAVKLSDLTVTENHEFEKIVGIPYGLKSMDMKLKGKMNGEVKFTGGADATFGLLSRAWKEVESESFSLLGVSGKVTGLESTDKVGKIPLVGLVFSVPCAATVTCPVTLGQNQTPLRAAKAGGVIVWLYLTANGELKFEGEVGVRVNSNLTLGVEQPEGGQFNIVADLSRASGLASSDNFLEAPFFNGELTAKTRLGIAVDLDTFVGGIRIANAAADMGAQVNFATQGKLANVLPDIGQNWRWVGNTCIQTSVGAGAIFSARAALGAEIKTAWKDVAGNLTYETQAPTAEEILVPGSHNVLGVPTWYTQAGDQWCFPQPVAKAVSVIRSANEIRWIITGEHLPDDLALSVNTAGTCITAVTADILAVDSGTKATFTCKPTSQIKDFDFELSSKKASNLDASAINGNWMAASAKINAEQSAASNYDINLWATNILSSAYQTAKSMIFDFGDGVATAISNIANGMTDKVKHVFETSGIKTVTVRFQDALGGQGNTVGLQTKTVTVLAAAVPSATITDATSDSSTKPGPIPRDGTTDDTTPTLSGTISAPLPSGHNVNVWDGAIRLDPAAVVAPGGTTWTFTPATPLSSGLHSFTVDVSDFQGTSSARSAPYVVNVQPVQVPVATSCGATIASTPFSENFSSNTLDATKWSVDSTGGSVVQNGKLTVSSNGTNRFPYIQTKANPFPASGDFSFYCKAKYLSIGNNGVGACNAVQNVIIPGAATLTYERGTRFEHWSSGFYTVATNIAALGSVQSLYFFSDPAATTAHDYETCVVGNTVSTYRDGLQIGSATLPAGWVRPTNIFMGNPVIGSSGIAWSSFEVNNIEVRRLTAPQNQGSFQVNANNPLGTAFTVPNGVAACTFNATGNWINSGVTSDANGDPAFPRNITLYLQSAYFFSLIAKSMNGYQFIGTSQEIPVAAGQTLSFMTNEGVSASDFYYDNSGSLLVSYTCH